LMEALGGELSDVAISTTPLVAADSDAPF
jgi:hypothetical protein